MKETVGVLFIVSGILVAILSWYTGVGLIVGYAMARYGKNLMEGKGWNS